MSAPYIMPNGGSLASYLRAERDQPSSSRRKGKSARPKEELFAQVLLQGVRLRGAAGETCAAVTMEFLGCALQFSRVPQS